MEKIILATNNMKKVEELKKMLVGFEVISQKQAGIFEDVKETGLTFKENAIIKARAIKNILDEKGIHDTYIVAEDSGICIECLKGYPGVKTKRAATEEIGENITDEKRNEYYIKKVGENKNRKVEWITSIAVISPDGNIQIFEGTVEGEVAKEPQGQNGFGFDPIFFIKEKKKTLAQMDFKEKEEFSARKRAVEKLVKYLNKNCTNY